MPRAAPVTRLTLPDRSDRMVPLHPLAISARGIDSADQDISHGPGFSSRLAEVWRNRAAGAPSTIRWSNVRLSVIDRGRHEAAPITTAGADDSPMPSTAHSGGLMIGVKASMPNAPRLVTVNVPPCSSSSLSLRSRRAVDQFARPRGELAEG